MSAQGADPSTSAVSTLLRQVADLGQKRRPTCWLAKNRKNMDKHLKFTEKKAAEVEGWLARGEGKLLYRLSKQCTGRGVIVEIGSWKGKSTTWLGLGSCAGKGVQVHAIDPHTGSTQLDDGSDRFERICTFHE